MVIDNFAMADECDVSKIVTTFLLNTCRLPMRLTVRDLWAVERCAMLQTGPASKEVVGLVPLITGSVAEFYIDPMLSCVGDIDVMFHLNHRLAIPRGHSPPTQLPAEFHNYVELYEFIDSPLGPPRYVCLQFRYLLTQCPNGGKYVCFESDERPCLLSLQVDIKGFANHGPAMRTDFSDLSPYCMSVDAVHCVRCLTWPLQAAVAARCTIVDHLNGNVY